LGLAGLSAGRNPRRLGGRLTGTLTASCNQCVETHGLAAPPTARYTRTRSAISAVWAFLLFGIILWWARKVRACWESSSSGWLWPTCSSWA
jgi:hypothetical protein